MDSESSDGDMGEEAKMSQALSSLASSSGASQHPASEEKQEKNMKEKKKKKKKRKKKKPQQQTKKGEETKKRRVAMVANIRGVEEASPYCSNLVRTSRYTVLTFLPMNLFEQLIQLQNFYFLCVGAMQIPKAISTSDGLPNMWVPLAFILFVSGLRAAVEDYGRHKADRAESSRIYYVFRGSESGSVAPKRRDGVVTVEVRSKSRVPHGFVPIKSADIIVGEIVCILENQPVPADVVLLRSSNARGHCFVETSSLDGETDLKPKVAVSVTHAAYPGPTELDDLEGLLVYEPPNKVLDEFRCQMVTELSSETVKLSAENLLLRGTVLKNTKYVFGFTVYTGGDTKIRRNVKQGTKKLKKSSVMRVVDRGILTMLALQSCLCFVGGLLSGVFTTQNRGPGGAWYLKLQDSGAEEGVIRFFTWFIILSQLVPISLLVSSEIVKTFQAFFINRDIEMYDEETDTPALVRNSQLNEDLGQVQYIFSDKTGTLTQNRMDMKVALVAIEGGELPHRVLGDAETEISKRVKALKNRDVGPTVASPTHKRNEKGAEWTSLVARLADQKKEAGGSKFSAKDELLSLLWGVNGEEEKRQADDADFGPSSPNRQMLRRYLTHMALSNTISPVWDDHTSSYVLQATSPDELALAKFAQAMGFGLVGRNPTRLEISKGADFPKEEEEYRLIATLGFNSKRKRVTMVYESGGVLHVMCKGADSSIEPLLSDLTGDRKAKLESDLEQMARNGLRTLLVCYSELDVTWWDTFHNEYEDAVALPETGEELNHSKGACSEACRICATFLKIEEGANLKLLGATAIEDQLQELVPESIEDYLSAGVKVWMLTGDKRETAKNIGMACNLVDPDMEHQDMEQTRLIEVTGSWSKILDNRDELRSLFHSFDSNGDGFIDLKELQQYMHALHDAPLKNEDDVELLFQLADTNGDGVIDLEEFIALMRSVNVSMFEAVESDVRNGVAIMERAQGQPVSMVIEGHALAVLYPPTQELEKEERKTQMIREHSISLIADMAGDRPSLSLRPIAAVSAERREKLRDTFFKLAVQMKSVVCCRLTPFQKAKIVQEVKARQKAVTLAIGDGANDEAMIVEADVGVGISGLEGTAASRAASYAIGKFRFLHTLLFVHGFWSYRRISKLVLYIFYKAIMVVMTMFWYGAVSGFSGQQLVNDMIYQWYNVLFTSAPILVLAVLDQGLQREILENNPVAYGSIVPKVKGTGLYFSERIFYVWIFRAFAHAALIYIVVHFSMGMSDVSRSNGQTHGIWVFSTVIYTCVVLLATFRLVQEMVSITWIHQLFVWISFLGYFLLLWVISIVLADFNPDMVGVVSRMYGTPSAWLVILLATSIPLLVDIAYEAYLREFHPTVPMVLQERQTMSRESRVVMPEIMVPAVRSLLRNRRSAASPRSAKLDAPEVEEQAQRKKPKTHGSRLESGGRVDVLVQHIVQRTKMSGSNFDHNGVGSMVLQRDGPSRRGSLA